MLYIVVAKWSVVETNNGYFGPFTKGEADDYLAYLLKGQPESARECFFIKELHPPLDDYWLEKVSRGIAKGSKTAVRMDQISLGQDFLYFGVRHQRIKASSPDAEYEMIHNRGVIPAMTMEGKGFGYRSGIPKEHLVEPL